jgi:uncharacterized membrane protein YfcA
MAAGTELLAIGLSACLVSGLTLFSGFGLGTVLTPVFALFFPVTLAVAVTAVVHFANNLFKLGLLARQADWRVVARFSLPAALAAAAGASLLSWFDRLPVLLHYPLAGETHAITVVKAVIGLLIIVFALLELSPRFQELALPPRYLFLGGLLSGFFGGLSGNQGAFRSAFLIKAGLSKEAFVATGAVSAVIVDAVRLVVYGIAFLGEHFTRSRELMIPVVVGMACAFAGAVLGKRLLRKITLRAVQFIVAVMMLLVGGGLAMGLI